LSIPFLKKVSKISERKNRQESHGDFPSTERALQKYAKFFSEREEKSAGGQFPPKIGQRASSG